MIMIYSAVRKYYLLSQDRQAKKETNNFNKTEILSRCATTPIPPASSSWGSELLACDGGMELPLNTDELHKKIKTGRLQRSELMSHFEKALNNLQYLLSEYNNMIYRTVFSRFEAIVTDQG